MDYRKAVLEAVLEADRVHKSFDTRSGLGNGEGRIDVFTMLVERNVPLMFRPLTSLLGAFIDAPAKGVIVTTKRQLPIQRFTAAHEFGHFALNHTGSLDNKDILSDLYFTQKGDVREIQANAFAAQLLTPPWLINQHMEAQGWTPASLTEPAVVYQLSLRMGSSYLATCFALNKHQAITKGTLNRLTKIDKRQLKMSLAAPYQPPNWYGDVWIVSEKDHGLLIEGSRSDLVIFNLEERASAGYLWQFDDLATAGFEIVLDSHTGNPTEQVGTTVTRRVIARSLEDTKRHIGLQEVRPWERNAQPAAAIEFDAGLIGPMSAGLLPTQREKLLSAA